MIALLVCVVAVTLAYMLVTALLNGWMLPRLTVPATGKLTPEGNVNAGQTTDPRITISVLIPARNEAHRIGPALRSLMAQTDIDMEVVVLDDQSEDNTAAVVQAIAQGDGRVQLRAGRPLPAGWIGKPWACQQLAQVARGELLLFTDADVVWESGALAALVHEFQTHNVDLLTAWPTQITVTWAERLTVPLMAMTVLGYVPIWLVNATFLPGTGIAVGQCLLFRRTAYWTIGGHEAIRRAIVDDMALAAAIKRRRLRLRMIDAHQLIWCRMYETWRDAFDGYTKNILAGHGDSLLLLAASTFVHWTLFLGPWFWLAMGWIDRAALGWPTVPLLLGLTGVAVRAVTAHSTGQRVGDALLLPISVLAMTGIAVRAVWGRWRYGGPQWKGRKVG